MKARMPLYNLHSSHYINSITLQIGEIPDGWSMEACILDPEVNKVDLMCIVIS